MSSAFSNFLKEIRRRKGAQVLLANAAAAWLVWVGVGHRTFVEQKCLIALLAEKSHKKSLQRTFEPVSD
jgi:hypothetical protein